MSSSTDKRGARFAAAALLAALGSAPLQASEIRVIGQTWPVAEPDVIEWMKAKMAESLTPEVMASLREEQTAAFRAYLEHPPAVEGVTRTSTPELRWFDPSIVLEHDVINHEGRVLWPAGTRYNPLDYRRLSRELLFVDAGDEDQVEWLETRLAGHGNALVILVGGSPRAMMERFQRYVAFDQKGQLVARLGIRQVPAIVSQERNLLRIEEVRP